MSYLNAVWLRNQAKLQQISTRVCRGQYMYDATCAAWHAPSYTLNRTLLSTDVLSGHVKVDGTFELWYNRSSKLASRQQEIQL